MSYLLKHNICVRIYAGMLSLFTDIIKYLVNISHVEISAKT